MNTQAVISLRCSVSMAAFFHSGEGRVELEVGEYQEFPGVEQETSARERSSKPELRLCILLLLCGLLCVLQAVLNVTLRLVQSPITSPGLLEEQLCPQGWLKFRASCYFFSRRRDNWTNSRIECLRVGADLVIINDLQEQAFLTGFREAAWVGMTDMKEEGTWLWVDGTPVEDRRVRWAQGQPDGAFGGEDCGELHFMNNFINLNDYNCNTRLQWICEKKLNRKPNDSMS